MLEGQGVGRESCPDQRAQLPAGQALQRPFGALERLEKLALPRRRQQLALEVVGPAVVGADEAAAGVLAAAALQQGHTAVRAAVEEGARTLAVVAGVAEQQGNPQQLHGQGGPLRQVSGGSHRVPAAVAVEAALPLGHHRRGVYPAGQKGGGAHGVTMAG